MSCWVFLTYHSRKRTDVNDKMTNDWIHLAASVSGSWCCACWFTVRLPLLNGRTERLLMLIATRTHSCSTISTISLTVSCRHHFVLHTEATCSAPACYLASWGEALTGGKSSSTPWGHIKQLLRTERKEYRARKKKGWEEGEGGKS